jgi:proline dehydrogenase
MRTKIKIYVLFSFLCSLHTVYVEKKMTDESDKFILGMFKRFDTTDDGYIDSIEWTTSLKANDTRFLADKCINKGTFYESALDEEECNLVETLMNRANTLVQLAENLDVKIMFDAEHSYFQPAIHNIVLDLQRTYNKDTARVYNTFQMYLKSSERELERSIVLSEREGWHFATKLVRGAYMILERERALNLDYESPIHESLEDTHKCYDSGVKTVLERRDVQNGTSKANLLIASHNQASVEKAIHLMNTNNIDQTNGGVAFGQLLGMADFLSFSLGHAGFQAYKYLPYGPFYEVLPYLVRRAQENSGLLSGGAYERSLIFSELKRRLFKRRR